MEKVTRYSKKREAIWQALSSTTAHPNADWIYQTLRPQYPDLSLATVYRNLARFKDEGMAISVATVNGQERFDARVQPHSHFICRSCGAVEDLLEIKQEDIMALTQHSAGQGGMTVERSELTCYGVCAHCADRAQMKAN